VRAVTGDVIALGGLKTNDTSDTRSGVPFLSKLPIVGKLFSNDDKEKSEEELMFVLTPEIVDDQPAPLDMNLKVAPAPAQAGS
jgi:general secretion pathway protein D